MIINNLLELYCILDHFLFEKCYKNLFRIWIELRSFTCHTMEEEAKMDKESRLANMQVIFLCPFTLQVFTETSYSSYTL